MTAEYSAHPALAPAQLQRAEATQSHHRRHHHGATSGKSGGGGGGVGGGGGGGVAGGGSSSHQATTSPASTSSKSAATATALSLTTDAAPTLPDRTAAAAAAVLKEEDEDDDVCCDDDNNDDDDVSVSAGEVASVDETDHVQHRFSRTATASAALSTSLSSRHQQHTSSNNNNNTTTTSSSSSNNNKTSFHCSRQQPHLRHQPPTATSPPCAGVGRCVDDDNDDDGDGSGLSSAGCSPSASTTSSPLSTPTRLVVPPCCQKTAAGAAAAAATASSTSTTMSAAATEQQHPHNTHPHLHHHNHNHQHQQQPHHQHQHQHQHHHHHHHHHSVAGCKKLQKFDPRLGPSPYRQLLPIALCILSFATVFSILIVYMDTTEIRHQQFRLNMSRDYELNGVAQDDPTLIAFLREIHMKKYPMHFLKNRDVPTLDQQQQQQYPHLNFSGHHELTPEMAHYVADLVGRKQNGAVIQSLPGAMGQMLTAPWLAGTLNWAGVIVEPEPRRYFALRKQNAHHPKMQVVHACVSPNEHPKEVTIHNEDAEVRINSLLDEETSWFNSRVKCFPLYTIMLACNRVEYDLLSLGVHGHELEILQTLPFDRIQIEVISIHFPEDHDNVRGYIQSVTKFLKGKSYKLQRKFGRNYFYQKINSTNRTRKKDILLMKQP